jgi:ppGpp synthetase/RelA/SpoT-type nucleotidyltranferase
MSFPKPEFSKSEINKAGKTLSNIANYTLNQATQALEVLANWRACHGYPMNTFNATLRRVKLPKIGEPNALVAQRLKRMPTIIDKLHRYPSMNLTQMQDIGGLRAVVPNIRSVEKLVKSYESSKFDHILEKKNDYISSPKPDGYRSVHLVYRYRNPQNTLYNGLLIELQIRTKLQHIWATAVETMGTFLGQALKSRQGDKEWLDFFALVSSAFSYLEKTTPIPGYEQLSKNETYKAIAKAAGELSVIEKMKGYSTALKIMEGKSSGSSYHLVILDSKNKTVEIKSYARNELAKATKEYTEVESRAAKGEKIEPVLVSTNKELKRAYPNYFLDVNDFISTLDKEIISKVI